MNNMKRYTSRWIASNITYQDELHETLKKFLCLPYSKQRIFFTEIEVFKKKGGSGWLNKNWKECFLNGLAIVIKKDPTTSR